MLDRPHSSPTRSKLVKNLFDIEGKTALVTGGTRGIGLMIARGYVENGVRLYVASRSEQACAETE
ncbi:MAG: SDR family NAD(P)-dependent oxidoreductase, partial [bacterium]|nr:SDR family NAD(P)-dependent oxidoreductase [bacterium]